MATLRERNGQYILIWQSKHDRDERGKPKQHWENLGALAPREAEKRRREKERELAAATSKTRQSGISLSNWSVEYLAWHAAEYPDSHFRVEQLTTQHLLPALGEYPIDTIPPLEVENYKTKRRFAGAKSGTVGKEIRTLHAIINRAVELNIIARSSIASVNSPRILDSKAPNFYSEAQLAKLYAACVEPWHAPVWRLLANSGMRRGEALNMRWFWVKDKNLNIESTGEDRTKSGLWRAIPLSEGAALAIEQIRALAGKPDLSEYVLPQITAPSLSRAFIRDAKRAGIGGSMHDLRHTYISHLVMRGVPLRVVKAYAGHSTIAVTERYSHLDPNYGHAAAAALSL
jgi:integrase